MPEPQPSHWLEREDVGDLTVLRVQAPLLRADDATEGVFDAACALVDATGRSRLVLNLERVVLLASAAVGRLVLLMRKAASAGGKLVLCNIAQHIFEVFEITRLDKMFNIQKDEQAALQAF